jgi:hypothetical protein
MRCDLLFSLLARVNAYWLNRLLYMTREQRLQYARDRAIEKHPELRVIEEKIRAMQSTPVGKKGSCEEWTHSENIGIWIDKYERRRKELLNLDQQPATPEAELSPDDSELYGSQASQTQTATISLAEYGDLLGTYVMSTRRPEVMPMPYDGHGIEPEAGARTRGEVSDEERAASEAALNDYIRRKEQPPSQELRAKQQRLLNVLARTRTPDDEANAAGESIINKTPQRPHDASHVSRVAMHPTASEPPPVADERGNVVPFPTKGTRGMAENLVSADYRDIDGITAGMERVSLGLPGSYLVVTWYTRVRSGGDCANMILCMSPFYGEVAARHFASLAIDHLARSGATPEPNNTAYGPRLRTLRVPEIVRASVRVIDDHSPIENYVSLIVLGRFPSNIIGAELVEMFGGGREKLALEDLFAFYGPANRTPPTWLEDESDPDKLGSPAWFYYQLTPLVGTESEKSVWVDNRIVQLKDSDDRPRPAEEVLAQVNKKSASPKGQGIGPTPAPETNASTLQEPGSEKALAPKPYSLKEWQAFMRDVDRRTTFHDFSSAFLGTQLYTILPELKQLVDRSTAKDKSAMYAVKDGAIYSVWLDEHHNHLAIDMAAKGDVPAHVALLSLSWPSC